MKISRFAMKLLTTLLLLGPGYLCCPTTRAPETTTIPSTVPLTTTRELVTQPPVLTTPELTTPELTTLGTATTKPTDDTSTPVGKDPCPKIVCELDENDIRYKHLKEREAFKLTGYIPTAGSGVTIATGVDLGQQTEDGLKRLGVPESVLKKLRPYLGLKTEAEVKAAGLKPENLKLTKEEAIHLDCLFLNKVTNVVMPYAEKMTAKGLACLISLRHWAGALGNTKVAGGNGKLAVYTDNTKTTVKNYVWDAIKDKTCTDASLIQALKDTLLRHTKGTAAYNRIQHEINYMQN